MAKKAGGKRCQSWSYWRRLIHKGGGSGKRPSGTAGQKQAASLLQGCARSLMKEASYGIRTHDLSLTERMLCQLSERGDAMPAGRLGSREGAGLVPMAKHMKSSNLPPSVGYVAHLQSG